MIGTVLLKGIKEYLDEQTEIIFSDITIVKTEEERPMERTLFFGADEEVKSCCKEDEKQEDTEVIERFRSSDGDGPTIVTRWKCNHCGTITSQVENISQAFGMLVDMLAEKERVRSARDSADSSRFYE